MFAIKKTTKQGTCAAMRCNTACNPAVSDLLCERHNAEWLEAGSPVLERDPAARTGALATTGTAVMIPAGLEGELTKEREAAQEALRMVMQIPLDTPEQREFAGALLKQTGQEIERLDDKRTSAVKPLNEVVKTINSWFKPATQYLEQIKAALKDRLSAKILEIEAERTKALAAIAADPSAASSQAYAIAHAPQDVSATVGVRRKVIWRITDFNALPAEYKMLVANEAQIAAAVSMTGLGTKIPGVVVEESVSVAAR